MALLLFREERAVTQEVRTTEETQPTPPATEPPGDESPEMKLESEDHTPEEAGYGYGV
jgi:hypothetical protein